MRADDADPWPLILDRRSGRLSPGIPLVAGEMDPQAQARDHDSRLVTVDRVTAEITVAVLRHHQRFNQTAHGSV